jgi:hypothetical protein
MRFKANGMNGPTQPKVIGEDWSDERVRSFLELRCYDQTDPDFHVLREAYEHMIAYDFERFIEFFVVSGRNINALNNSGETIIDRISAHASNQEFVDILKKAGGTSAKRSDSQQSE